MANEEPTTIDDVAEAIGGTIAANRRDGGYTIDAPVAVKQWWFDLAEQELHHVLNESERNDLISGVRSDLDKRAKG